MQDNEYCTGRKDACENVRHGSSLAHGASNRLATSLGQVIISIINPERTEKVLVRVL